MIVICEECGKRYRVDPTKIKGVQASFRCRSCNHVVTVVKPEAKPPEPPSPRLPEEPTVLSSDEGPYAPELERREKRAPETAAPRLKRFGIRGKMFFLLILIPILMLAIALPFTVRYINQAIDLIVSETAQSEVERAKNQINQSASAIAKQVEFYLLGHPELKREDFHNDPALREILFQRVLIGADASLYLRFDPEKPGTFLINRDKSLEGQPLKKLMVRGVLGKTRYDEFGKIVRIGAKAEYREALGLYLSRDKDGNLREKILALAPVSRTPYGIILTADTDDFMLPAKRVEDRVRNLISETRNIVFGVVGGTLLLIGIIMLLYAHRLTGKIKSLTDVTNRISVGELEAQIDIKSRDEIGELAEAVSRMQDSIRLSIERLRRRR